MNWTPGTNGRADPVALGWFNWSVEEKIAVWMLDNWVVDDQYNEAQLYAMLKPLLGMYQQGILQEQIPVLDLQDQGNVDQITLYLVERSQLPITVVAGFLEGLWALTQEGTLELKHMDPAERKTSAISTKVLPTLDDLANATPKALTSVLDVDLPAFIQRNLLTISLVGVSATMLIIFARQRGTHGRTA